jgi:hypothetical protein
MPDDDQEAGDGRVVPVPATTVAGDGNPTCDINIDSNTSTVIIDSE